MPLSVMGRSYYSDNQSPTSDNHFLGGDLLEVVRGRQMFVDGRWLVVRELHRQPLADLRQPPFCLVVFGGLRWSANDCRWSPTSRRLVVRTVWSARSFRCSIENLSPTKLFSLFWQPIADWTAIIDNHLLTTENLRKPPNKKVVVRGRRLVVAIVWLWL